MKIPRTVRWTRNMLSIAAVLALAVLPAAAAVEVGGTGESPARALHDPHADAEGVLVVHTQDSAPAAGGSVVTDGTIVPAPAVPETVSSAADDAGAATPQAASTGLDGEVSSPADSMSAQSAAGSVPSDESGTTEVEEVQRSCGAPADPHYVPSKGRDSNQCYDNNGNFQSGRKYTAMHYTNDVQCGKETQVPFDITGSGLTNTWVTASAGADGGHVQYCADGTTPGHGRVTARADADGSLQVVFDGDRDNPEEISQGWAVATVSADGVEYRCGKPYNDGGRGSSDAPTSQDNAEQCNP